ncbi:unnamed protein product [Calypogeia fissa]
MMRLMANLIDQMDLFLRATWEDASLKKKYYVMVRGFNARIYKTWKECDKQVWDFNWQNYKDFSSKAGPSIIWRKASKELKSM